MRRAELLRVIRSHVARSCVSASTVRGDGNAGALEAARSFFRQLDLRPFGTREFVRQRLVLPFADRGKRAPLRPARGVFVKIDGDAELIADALAESMRERDTIGHRDAGDRHERTNVGRAVAGMRARVRRHIDDLRGALDRAKRRFLDRVRSADKSHDGAIGFVARIDVDQLRAIDCADHFQDFLEAREIATFRKVRHALDNALRHGGTLPVEVKS